MSIYQKNTGLNADELRAQTLQRANTFIRMLANSKHSERQEASQFEKSFLDIFNLDFLDAKLEHSFRSEDGHIRYADLFWPGELLMEMKSSGSLEYTNGSADAQAFAYVRAIKQSYELPKIVIVSDFNKMRIFDLRPLIQGGLWNGEIPKPHEFDLKDLTKEENFSILQFLAGREDLFCGGQLEVTKEAAEVLGKLFTLLSKKNYPEYDRTLFIMRIMFCLFAENSHIFENRSFTEYILTSIDHGQDVSTRLNLLFEILDTETEERSKKECPWDLSKEDPVLHFPFVDGGLFSERIATPPLNNTEAHEYIVENCSVKDWSKVSPAIFGALFQSIRTKEDRRQLGEHYTSLENIKKVIEPLFLLDLNNEYIEILNECNGRKKDRLKKFQEKLGNIQLLDPACGCGNFLIVAYQELRNLEHRVLRELYAKEDGTIQLSLELSLVRKVTLSQLHGIEIDTFPAMIAKTAAWLQDHLANERLSALLGKHIPTIPLRVEAHILQENALHLDWETCFPDCSGKPFDYIFGNPPFNGARTMSKAQKADMKTVFSDKIRGFGDLDYVTAWFWKAKEYMLSHEQTCSAFVATNSITQGQHVGLLWKPLFEKKIAISFAYRTFKWDNEAKGRAAVHCVIIGMQKRTTMNRQPTLWDEAGVRSRANVINPYLYDSEITFLENRKHPICDVPELSFANQIIDNGYYLFSEDEKNEFIGIEKESEKYFFPFLGAREFIQNKKRYILLVDEINPLLLKNMSETRKRIELVKEFRSKSRRLSTVRLSSTPKKFQTTFRPSSDYIVIPQTSSENREYIPIGILSKDILCSEKLFVIDTDDMYIFAILTSSVHMTWMRLVAGRMKSDYSYSIGIVYNNFPWPKKPKDTSTIETLARNILDVRKRFSDISLAVLYDPITMPEELRKAHKNLDAAVLRLYRLKVKSTKSDILSHLFRMYTEITKHEK